MANEKSVADAGTYKSAQPVVRTIGVADLKDVLAKGLSDFKAVPTHVMFIILIYPIVMFVSARLVAGYEILPLIFPLVAGYTLIGPLAATGMYELSRRREQGLDVARRHAFGALVSPSIGNLVTLGLVLMVIYVVWLVAALAIYAQIFGDPAPTSIGQFAQQAIALDFGGAGPKSIMEFARQIYATPSGWTLIIIGSTVGFLFAAVVLTLSVVSFPMLLDTNVSPMMAMRTSVRAVLANPMPMAVWGFIVAAILLLGSLPFFVGLAIALPVLGHATWHLYRKVVVTDAPHRT